MASGVDQKEKVAPSIDLGQVERGHVAEGPCEGGPEACRTPFYPQEGADVIRVPVPDTRHTAPRRGVSSRMRCWSFDGVIVLSAHTPVRPSGEGVGMT